MEHTILTIKLMSCVHYSEGNGDICLERKHEWRWHLIFNWQKCTVDTSKPNNKAVATPKAKRPQSWPLCCLWLSLRMISFLEISNKYDMIILVASSTLVNKESYTCTMVLTVN